MASQAQLDILDQLEAQGLAALQVRQEQLRMPQAQPGTLDQPDPLVLRLQVQLVRLDQQVLAVRDQLVRLETVRQGLQERLDQVLQDRPEMRVRQGSLDQLELQVLQSQGQPDRPAPHQRLKGQPDLRGGQDR